jgi:beta-1,2-mannosidase
VNEYTSMERKTNRPVSGILVIIIVMLTQCSPSRTSDDNGIERDSSWAMLPFTKVDSVNPVLHAGNNVFICPVLKKEVRWDEKDVFNPAAVVRDNKVYLVFRAEDKIGKHAGTSRLGLAVSEDGLHFTRMKEPVFFPDNDSLKVFEWEGGVEDPRIVEAEDSTYVMTYTAFDGKVARLLIARSKDLVHWTKYGTVLNGKYKDSWSKSGAIVARQTGSRIVAEKVNGKYWMYFGDTDLFMATSEDLIHWQPVEENGKLKSVLTPRKGYFDSRLVESGPYALLVNGGILLIYNGMNLDEGGDAALAKGAYCAGQALFSMNDPTLLVDRLEINFMKPDKPYETTGQINQVCFLEGLVPFNGKWFLYYGTADSKIAVAVHE